MRILLGMLLVFVVLVLLVVGGGIGIGLLLHWLIPAVDPGIGILTGVLATIFVFQMVGRLISLAGMFPEEEDTEPEVISPVTYVIDQLPPAPPRRTSKRRRSREGGEPNG